MLQIGAKPNSKTHGEIFTHSSEPILNLLILGIQLHIAQCDVIPNAHQQTQCFKVTALCRPIFCAVQENLVDLPEVGDPLLSGLDGKVAADGLQVEGGLGLPHHLYKYVAQEVSRFLLTGL